MRKTIAHLKMSLPFGSPKHRLSRLEEGERYMLENEKKTLGANLNFVSAEAFKLLRTNISFALPNDKGCRVVGVTSSIRGEGKSTTAMNLAYMLAEAGEWVLLVEGDMRLPTVSKRLGLPNSPGLSNLLAGISVGEEVIQSSGIQDQLRVIVAGDIPPNPSELLGSAQMEHKLNELARDFDYIILDLPPVTAVSDALIVSKLTHGMVMVVRQNYASRRGVNEAMRQLKYANANMLGFVLTDSNIGSKNGKYGKYGKYKQYGYYGDYSQENGRKGDKKQ